MFTLPTKEGHYCRDDTDDDDFADDLRAAVVDTFGGYLLEHTPELVGAFHTDRHLNNFDRARFARHEYKSILDEFVISRDLARDMAIEYFAITVHQQYTLAVDDDGIITEFVPRWPRTTTETMTYQQFARAIFGGAYRIDEYVRVHYDKMWPMIDTRTPNAKILLRRSTRRPSIRL